MRLTKRGKIALTLAIVAGVVGLLWLVDHVNWMGNHWCFHSLIVCEFGKGN